jgi:hypothetical protein
VDRRCGGCHWRTISCLPSIITPIEPPAAAIDLPAGEQASTVAVLEARGFRAFLGGESLLTDDLRAARGPMRR